MTRTPPDKKSRKRYAKIKGPYLQKSIKGRIKALFLDNIGKVVTREQIWQALCGRHQVVKKNYWDHTTGKLNVYAIIQAANEEEKRSIYRFLKEYFGDT